MKQLMLVVNYSCPNHYEDYVHRAGRTGRAGNKVCTLLLVSSVLAFSLLYCLMKLFQGIATEGVVCVVVGKSVFNMF